MAHPRPTKKQFDMIGKILILSSIPVDNAGVMDLLDKIERLSDEELTELDKIANRLLSFLIPKDLEELTEEISAYKAPEEIDGSTTDRIRKYLERRSGHGNI